MADLDLQPLTAALEARLDAFPGAVADPYVPPRGTHPLVLMYKVMGKIFAILNARGAQGVIVKSDPHLAEILREQYDGVGHRSHLDRRFWISIDLAADVPPEEVERLIERSYELVCSGLSRKQQAALAVLA
ncbi:MmcQ/YjbR family DNA-binding protein [soil metagenome]